LDFEGTSTNSEKPLPRLRFTMLVFVFERRL
jgi:hypothetical protein